MPFPCSTNVKKKSRPGGSGHGPNERSPVQTLFPFYQYKYSFFSIFFVNIHIGFLVRSRSWKGGFKKKTFVPCRVSSLEEDSSGGAGLATMH
jgi:hypothetical protein